MSKSMGCEYCLCVSTLWARIVHSTHADLLTQWQRFIHCHNSASIDSRSCVFVHHGGAFVVSGSSFFKTLRRTSLILFGLLFDMAARLIPAVVAAAVGGAVLLTLVPAFVPNASVSRAEVLPSFRAGSAPQRLLQMPAALRSCWQLLRLPLLALAFSSVHVPRALQMHV
jgi:hypothetical protein